jgi:streptogramin lyase
MFPFTVNSQTWTVFGFDTVSSDCKTYAHITVFNDTLWYGASELEGKTLTTVVAPSQLFECDLSKSDHNGNLWFVGSITADVWTTHGNAYTVYKFDGSKWFDYSPPKSFGYDGCNSVTFQKDGKIWLTSSDSGAYMYDGSTWHHYIKSSVFSGANSMAIDNNGNKWFATNNGLIKFDGSNYAVFNSTNSGLKFNVINDLTIDKNGNIWLATGTNNDLGDTTNGRIIKFDGTNWTYYKPFNDGQGLNYANTIAIDPNGKIWAGMFLGLSVFDGSNWTNYTDSHTSSSNLQVLSIDFDSHGNTWLGTTCGILEFQGNSVSINNSRIYNEISIFPNPAKSIIRINLNGEIRNAEISIFDINGILLLEKNISSNNLQIDISNFKQGIYFISYNTGSWGTKKQFIKE